MVAKAKRRAQIPRTDDHKARHRKITTATPSSVRDVNRALILDLVRLHEPISRAGLSKRTGIHRSNVSAIVEQLMRERLVTETPGTPKGRGRIPFLLSLHDDGCRFLGVSIRPSETTVASSGLTGRIQRRLSTKTPRNPAELLRWIVRAANLLQKDGSRHPFREIGISAPGLVNSESGTVVWIPALPKYTGFPLRREIERRTGIRAVIDNDCNLGALAELCLAEKEIAGIENFVFLEVGDVGVGAGLILHREVYAGHDFTFAGEFGHMVIDPSGPKCTCGRRGCWELYVCNRAVWNRYDPGAKFETTRFDDLIQKARKGERRAVAVFQEAAHYGSLGLSNVAFSLNPEVIIVAGKITKVWDLIHPILEKDFASSRVKTKIRPARLDAGELFLCGAVLLATRQVFSKPKLG